MDNNTGEEPSHDVDNASSLEVPLGHEKAKLLALPSPIDILGLEKGSWRSWLSVSSWIVAASLGVMKAGLRFKVCQLPNSYLPNSEIPDLAERVNQVTSPIEAYYPDMSYWKRRRLLI
jgi:hypothetical protein